MTTWIVVAHRAGAKIFLKAATGFGLEMVDEIPYPEGRLRAHEINTDFDSDSNIAEVSPEEHKENIFAKTLALHLNQQCQSNLFDHLILIADAKFLSKLKSSFSAQLQGKVLLELKKNLGKASSQDLQQQVQAALQESPGRVA